MENPIKFHHFAFLASMMMSAVACIGSNYDDADEHQQGDDADSDDPSGEPGKDPGVDPGADPAADPIIETLPADPGADPQSNGG